jgi:enamine deaminase RidA (YjgF/YER057c/UK114 family)
MTLQPSSDGTPLIVRVRPRRQETRRKEVRVEKPPIKMAPIAMPLKPKDPSEIANPVPALLADATLRSGDLVMFPGGLRVFAGRSGDKHDLTDFEPLARSGKAVPAATRKMVAQLRPGSNAAWSADVVKASGKLALNTQGAEVAGKTKRKSR